MSIELVVDNKNRDYEAAIKAIENAQRDLARAYLTFTDAPDGRKAAGWISVDLAVHRLLTVFVGRDQLPPGAA